MSDEKCKGREKSLKKKKREKQNNKDMYLE